MHIKVKVPLNQDSATGMALIPVRVQILSLGSWDGGSEHLGAPNFDAMLLY